MLSNNLTLDEEDAVQAELRGLQADVVSQVPCIKCLSSDCRTQIQETQLLQGIEFPLVPNTEPVSDPRGTSLISRVPCLSDHLGRRARTAA